MKKWMNRVVFCLLLGGCLWCGTLISDRRQLREDLIRLHVVANSDSREDQDLKLQVRDAVTDALNETMSDLADVEEARVYLACYLPEIERLANETLRAAGSEQRAVVSLGEEPFATRYYDTFTLPAGVYDSLRITIGEGKGRNWWCVVFPTLCIGATEEEFSDTAAAAGFPEGLTDTLTGEPWEIRFFFLDALGKLENLLYKG